MMLQAGQERRKLGHLLAVPVLASWRWIHTFINALDEEDQNQIKSVNKITL
jgi:hypothetical protein